MLRKGLLWATVLIICLAGTSFAAGVEVAVGGWRQDLDGTLSYQAISSNDLIDLEEDINFDDEDAFFGRIKIETPAFIPNFYLVAAPAQLEGTGRKSVALTFGDTTFNADAALSSKVRANQYDIGIYYGLPFIKTATAGMLNLDVGVNIRIADLEVEITGASGGITVTEREDLMVPVPMLYAALQFAPIDALAFEAEIRAISVGDNSFYSLTGRLRLQFPGPFFIAGGYRLDKLEVDEDEDDLITDIELGGPFVEVGLKF
ncbi:MAG: TIGR04219 family outer membrane beta-barrel protein [Desulfobacteraceae bacterium]